jgi:hypothetical protein
MTGVSDEKALKPRQQHPLWSLLKAYGDACELLGKSDHRETAVGLVNAAWEALWAEISRHPEAAWAIEAAGYQCFVEGCPAKHRSKRELCAASKPAAAVAWVDIPPPSVGKWCTECGDTIESIDDGRNMECACGIWPNRTATPAAPPCDLANTTDDTVAARLRSPASPAEGRREKMFSFDFELRGEKARVEGWFSGGGDNDPCEFDIDAIWIGWTEDNRGFPEDAGGPNPIDLSTLTDDEEEALTDAAWSAVAAQKAPDCAPSPALVEGKCKACGKPVSGPFTTRCFPDCASPPNEPEKCAICGEHANEHGSIGHAFKLTDEEWRELDGVNLQLSSNEPEAAEVSEERLRELIAIGEHDPDKFQSPVIRQMQIDATNALRELLRLRCRPVAEVDKLYPRLHRFDGYDYIAVADYDAKVAELKRTRPVSAGEDAANAARYVWLRAHWDEPEVQKLHPWDEFSPDPDQLDAQIDAARLREGA